MRKKYLLLILLLCISQVKAQHFVTPSIGYGLAFYQSDDLDLFRDSYNAFQREFNSGMINGFSGLRQPVGFRAEVGYSYFGKFVAFASAGFQNFLTKDFADFDNRSRRNVKLKQSSFFLEGGLGPHFKQLFITGVVDVYFNRQMSLESSYNGTIETTKQALSGDYRGSKTFSTDLGIAFGVKKEAVVLMLKITYPLFTGGRDDLLVDDDIAKVADGTSVFPADLYEVLSTLDPDSPDYGNPYQGIRTNIDGLKIIITLGLPLQIGGSEE